MRKDIDSYFGLIDYLIQMIHQSQLFALLLCRLNLADLRMLNHQIENASFLVLRHVELCLHFPQRQEFLCFLLVEVEDDQIIEQRLVVILDKELAIYQSGEDWLSFVHLTIQQLVVLNDRLGQQDLYMLSLLDLLFLDLLNRHVELELLLEELLLHEEGSGGQRLCKISVFVQFGDYHRLEEVMLLENVLFVLLLIEEAVVALPTDRFMALLADHTQQAGLWNRKKSQAGITYYWSFEDSKVIFPSLVLQVVQKLLFPLSLALHKLLEVGESLLESRPDRDILSDWPKLLERFSSNKKWLY
jgi:hypothetical protein